MKIRIIDTFLALLVLASILLSSCAQASTLTFEPTSSDPVVVDQPRLRVQNAGNHDIKGLVVLFPDSKIVFNDVPAGSTSEYQVAPKGVYNYAAYNFFLDGQESVQPVVDWVGESPRPGASYTYILDFDPARQQMEKIRLIQVLAP